MHSFKHKNGQMYCEDVELANLADRFGTPLFVYSRATLERHYRVFDEAFADFPHIICFAAKANSNLAILNVLARMGAGADIVSGGELFRCLKAGMKADRIVYSGVGKTRVEMTEALSAGILMFNIESFEELKVLDDVAGSVGKRARVALRVNPGIDPKTHPYVATGLKKSKFGIRLEDVIEGYEFASGLKNVDVVGIDCHIGSQLTQIGPFVEAVKWIRELLMNLKDKGFAIKYLDIGGGLGITYDDEQPPSPAEYAKAIKEELVGTDVTLILEPGRNLVGNAGVMLSRVLYNKETEGKEFVVVDAGMNDLIRPSLYEAYHDIKPVVEKTRPNHTVDIVGPICESGDFLAKDRELPELKAGDLIAVMSAGAYAFSMSSTYNSRPLAAEVMVDGKDAFLVRSRGTYEDLVRREKMLQKQ